MNEPKRITEEEVAEYLRRDNRVEWEEYYQKSSYNVHMTADGEFCDSCSDADKSFYTLFDFDDFEIPEDERDVEDGLDCIWNRETMDTSAQQAKKKRPSSCTIQNFQKKIRRTTAYELL